MNTTEKLGWSIDILNNRLQNNIILQTFTLLYACLNIYNEFWLKIISYLIKNLITTMSGLYVLI